MFNVTVLRMKDIMRFFLGIIFVLLIIYFSKFLYKNKSENKISKELADGAGILTSNSMIQCLDDTILAIATINSKNETSILDNEKEENITKSNVLESILKTQISSLKALEISEKTEEKEKIEYADDFIKQTDNNIESAEKKIELARNRTTNTSYN